MTTDRATPSPSPVASAHATARRLARRTLGGVAAAATIALVLDVSAASAQLAPITFPDTAVGAVSTVKCPAPEASICFGSNCNASGTVQSLGGPSLPFKVGKLNLLSLTQFFAGSCEANPVTLPVTVGPGQVLAVEATFSPTAVGSFNGSITFNTAGGPATANLTGKGVAGPSGGTGQAVISLETHPEVMVPGNLLEIGYDSVPGTLNGNVDVYVALVLGGDTYLFFSAAGTSNTPVPFAVNAPVAEARTLLFSGVLVDVPFGSYTVGTAMTHTGKASLASNVSTSTFTIAPLSKEQTAALQERGNPEFLVVSWQPEETKKRESWFYYSGNAPTVYKFENGALTSQSHLPGPSPAPVAKVDPSLFTPQTTLQTLTAALGPPASVVATDAEALPGYQTVRYAFGLEVTLRDGRLVAARSVTE